MGVSARPFGKFGSQMAKIKNKRDAEIYSIKHANDNKKKEKKETSNEEN